MRNIFKALLLADLKLRSLVALIISLFIMWSASSYADWHGHDGDRHGHDEDRHGHSYIGINFSLWPDSYYYGAPYYPPADEVLVFPPVTVVQQPVTVVQPPTVVTTSTPGVEEVVVYY